MVIGLVAFLAVMMSPIIINSANAWLMEKKGTSTVSQACYVFTSLKSDLENVDAVTLPGSMEFEYKVGEKKYRLYAYDYNNGGAPPGTAPYEVRKADSTASFSYGDGTPVAGGIALLSSPTRPGLEFTYYDDYNQIKAVLDDIELVHIRLTFKEEFQQNVFENSIHIGKPRETIKR